MKTRGLLTSQTNTSSFGCLCLVVAIASGCQSQQGTTNNLAVSSVSQMPVDLSVSVNQQNANAEEIFERVYQARLARSPVDQAYLGVRDNQEKWDNHSDKYLSETNQLDKQHLKTLEGIDLSTLSAENRLNMRLYQHVLDEAIREFEWRYHRYPVNQMIGLHTEVITILTRLHPVETASDAKSYIERLNGIAELFDQLIKGLHSRAEMGIIAPKFIYEHVIRDSKNIISGQPFLKGSGTDSTLLADIKKKLVGLDITEHEKQQFQIMANKALLESVAPAYRKLIDAANELFSKAEHEGGAWKLPRGGAFYRHALRRTTTTDLDAEAIHQLGLEEVARIHLEMKGIIRKAKFKGDLQDFFAYLQTDPEFFFPKTEDGKQAYLDEAKRVVSEIKSRLPELFSVMPKAELVVKRVEPFREQSAGSAFYMSGLPDGARPGVFYVNTYDMSVMPIYYLQPLAYHEGLPGHHMQVMIARELDNMPTFRRFSGSTAYAEGWGLYSEFLPKEMGLYKDIYADFGRLALELWRASRLVVDSGLHYKRWTGDQAIDYLLNNTPNGRKDAVKAVERYLALPSQATAYKIGMLKILELRQNAKDRLGYQFDIRAFHDVVLKNGSLPLNILEEVVTRWIDAPLKRGGQ